jgi:DNA polymerase III epsilon subunit-like protein
MPETYISVDVESAGPIPGTYSLVALGACVVNRPQERFYAELRPLNRAFLPDAMKVIGRSFAYFTRSGRDPAEAIEAFGAWVAAVSKGRPPVFVGFNAPFDWSFVNWYFHTYIGQNPFGVAALDIKSYYMGLTGCSWRDTRSSRIPARLKGNAAHTHNALEDAIEQAEMFARMRKSTRARKAR